MDAIDEETGEVMPQNGRGHRISQNIQSARVQIERDRSGHGASNLHFATYKAVEKMPIWITAEKDGARGKYAPLKDILKVVRPPLHEQGVRIRQGCERSFPVDEGGGVKGRLIPVYTDLIHVVSGEWERTIVEMPTSRIDPQSIGSAITYGKRYSILAALGLASDEATDDDGASAMPRSVTDEVHESVELKALKAEIDKIKEPTKLVELGADPKFKKRANQLNEGETTILRLYYKAHGAKLVGDAE